MRLSSEARPRVRWRAVFGEAGPVLVEIVRDRHVLSGCDLGIWPRKSEVLRNGKVKNNPVRMVRQRKENDGVIRFLRDDEEKELRRVIEENYPEHTCELDVSLGTGMRLSEQYGNRLLWEQVDFNGLAMVRCTR